MAGEERAKPATIGCGRPVGWTGAMPVYCGRLTILCRRCKGRRGDGNGSPSTCGERWEDPFGEMNECGKPLGHGGPHLATWAMRLDAGNGSPSAGGES